MDTYGQPQGASLKVTVIVISVIVVVVGVLTVGALIYRSRQLATETPPVGVGSNPTAPSATTAAPTVKPSGNTITVPTNPAVTASTTPATLPLPPNTPNTPDFTGAKDSDGDGLSDVVENYYHTDPNKKDTDGDGYSDYDEIVKYGTDPLDPNSNPKTTQGYYPQNK
jgi:hypothetical protein